MYVYRLEDEDGIGAYKSEHSPSVGWCSDDHPMPNADGLHSFISGIHFFGFKSEEDFINWFGKILHIYRHFFFAKYLVKQEFVLVGGKQIAFERNKAKLIKKIPIQSLSIKIGNKECLQIKSPTKKV